MKKKTKMILIFKGSVGIGTSIYATGNDSVVGIGTTLPAMLS